MKKTAPATDKARRSARIRYYLVAGRSAILAQLRTRCLGWDADEPLRVLAARVVAHEDAHRLP